MSAALLAHHEPRTALGAHAPPVRQCREPRRHQGAMGCTRGTEGDLGFPPPAFLARMPRRCPRFAVSVHKPGPAAPILELIHRFNADAAFETEHCDNGEFCTWPASYFRGDPPSRPANRQPWRLHPAAGRHRRPVIRQPEQPRHLRVSSVRLRHGSRLHHLPWWGNLRPRSSLRGAGVSGLGP